MRAFILALLMYLFVVLVFGNWLKWFGGLSWDKGYWLSIQVLFFGTLVAWGGKAADRGRK